MNDLGDALRIHRTNQANRRPSEPPTEAGFLGLDRLTEVAHRVLGIAPPIRWSDESLLAIEARLRRIGLDPDVLTIHEAADAIEGSRGLAPPVCTSCVRKMADSEFESCTCFNCDRAQTERYQRSMAALLAIPEILGRDARHTECELIRRLDPNLRDYSLEKFSHETFSVVTLERLTRWLRVHQGLSEERFRGMPQAEVAELLKADLEQAKVMPVEVPLPTLSPVIASRRMLNVALGGSEGSKTLLETLQARGELSFTKSGAGNHSVLRVSMTDPDEHRRLRDYVDHKKGRR
jgi:hypothetical protein